LSIIATANKPTSGQILIEGRALPKVERSYRRRLAYVPQENTLYPSLTGWDNLIFWGAMYGMNKKELKSRMETVIHVIGLKDRIRDRVQTYSGGMKKRLSLGIGLIHHPEMLILDEPTAGVDASSRGMIMQTLKTLAQEGHTILLTSHHQEEQDACDRKMFLQKGSLVFQASEEIEKGM
ncbi:MAG TPA: ABC transporter ATP-binding protein, partial [Bacillota bacterium]|nr:ABC transporter ATP-binding protein [Bacillota bacterium]